MKDKYKIVRAIRENSGFGWDDTRKVATAPDDVWDRYIQVRIAKTFSDVDSL